MKTKSKSIESGPRQNVKNSAVNVLLTFIDLKNTYRLIEVYQVFCFKLIIIYCDLDVITHSAIKPLV